MTLYSTSKQSILRNTVNSLGFKTPRKLIVIESDDWGAIRMPSKEVFNYLVKKSIIDESNPFTKYDSLASETDLSLLFEVLESVSDKNGKPAVITANCIMANPDFERIKKSKFEEYYYEDFTDTLQKYPQHANSFKIWEEGIAKGIFLPQLHGREHVNVPLWLKKLQSNEHSFIEGFDQETYAVNDQIAAAFRFDTKEEMQVHNQTIIEASQLFKDKFGFISQSFIAPNYCWNKEIEQSLADAGIRYLQGTYKQNKTLPFNTIKSVFHYTGKKNRLNQMYLVRNCLFEPSVNRNLDYVSICLKHIKNAFLWNNPAIIASHRLNYIGYLEEKNRDSNLILLQQLLTAIIKIWPDVEFVSTADLTEIMDGE
jgi:hypothetical protein